MSIHSQPSIRINDSLHTVDHRLAQHVDVSGGAFGIILILFQCLFLLFLLISLKQIKVETFSCAQNVRLDILFPAVKNMFSLWKIGKNQVKILLSRSHQLFFSLSTAKSDFPFFYFELLYLLNEQS